ncbi:AAA family ATPase [Candidatus Woesearchaeota archaeon]|nr:AAA family ATPase [Candidatus Woesearchaeota archaeon]
MIIKKVKLENIRSYTKDEIEFSKGITLLSGDVGSGKSTILLAIDFALFGLRKGHLSGSTILRNGEKNGNVELNFEVDNRDFTIKRNLKRSSLGITQDYGILEADGKGKELSAVELKQFIISLLNYPQEYLTKSKNFIYNYTIYTPQEEMKQILIGEKEYRIDTIRKVFGIDKYKTVKENSKIFVDYLKIKKKEATIALENYHEKISDKEKTEKEIGKNKINYAELQKYLGNINSKIINFNKEIANAEENIKELYNKKKELEINEFNLKYNNEQKKKNNLETELLEKDITKLKDEFKEELIFNKVEKTEKENVYKNLNEEFNKIKIEISQLNIKKTNSIDIINSIKKLDKCPTCRQDVSPDYKNNIFSKENDNIKNLDQELINLNEKLKFINNGIKLAKEELDKIIAKEIQSEALAIKRKNLNEKTKKVEILEKNNQNINIEIDILNEKIKNLNNHIIKFDSSEKLYQILKDDLKKLQTEQKDFEIKKSVAENELLNLNTNLGKLDKEIEHMNSIKKKLTKYNIFHDFLSNNLISILDIIERKAMIKIKNEFDSFFQKWFSMLIDSETIKVRLDEEFTPVIEQAGHEIEYINLSGGEKTAAALAYRLALNQIINTFVSEIKTKDLLILDEPTDGFSSEQLDRLRNVLNELNTEQIIIVSHESKIESFVDRIIRLEKNEHVTKII